MRTVVLPDLHGRIDLAEATLASMNVPGSPWGRAAAGVVVVQVGDLANCVNSSVREDCESLDRARALIDVQIIGNHEYPYLNPRCSFSGFAHDPAVAERIERADNERRLTVSWLIDDILITHAGVTANLAVGGGWRTAEEAHRGLQAMWAADRHHWAFSKVGARRGGRGLGGGGVLWRDHAEPPAGFSQIHGHTPQKGGPEWHYVALNIDVGCGKGTASPPPAAIVTDGVISLHRAREAA